MPSLSLPAAAAATSVGVEGTAVTSAAAASAAAAGGSSLLAYAAIGSAVLGTLTSAIGASNQSAAMRSQALYQAQVAQNNQAIARQNAQLVTAAGEQASANQGMRTRAEIGAIKTAQAASNIDVNSGSAVDVRSSAAALGELNQLTIRSNAARQAYGYEVQATSEGAQAQLDTATAANAVRAGTINEVSTLLSGASSTATNAFKFGQAGVLF